ncbi:hypothetical protein ILUMI_23484 [Ignelater luminosus]|uniref:acid phosphatase n=1 Tax=Ignelater luminosus TaxID=2038154 RepID=A0A8K0CEI5_IGNLU|nr:hypothetical protein ILUMI_23484 [Ignelater luminosus]
MAKDKEPKLWPLVMEQLGVLSLFNLNPSDDMTSQLLWPKIVQVAPESNRAKCIFRHGNRTASRSYPTDPYINETYYPYGAGQLTNKGRNTAYHLGKTLRARYKHFLGSTYTPDLVDPVSSSTNRTKMSLELVLAGLFPPKGTALEWQKELNWQPIPYNYLPPNDHCLEEAIGSFFLLTTLTEELKQLTGGFLLKKIIGDSQAKIQNKLNPSTRKLFLYSAHDISVIYILSTMNVYFPHVPPYGAYVLIEVHKIDNMSGIMIYYQDYSQDEPRLLQVPGCDYF